MSSSRDGRRSETEKRAEPKPLSQTRNGGVECAVRISRLLGNRMPGMLVCLLLSLRRFAHSAPGLDPKLPRLPRHAAPDTCTTTGTSTSICPSRNDDAM